MTSPQTFLESILTINAGISKDKVRSILILYGAQNFFIGDSCIVLDKLKMCKQFFKNATVHLHFSNTTYIGKYQALLKNNPYIDKVCTLPLTHIEFCEYQLVICITHEEKKILTLLSEKYAGTSFNTAVYSFSGKIFPYITGHQPVFPEYTSLLEFSEATVEPKELYISTEERIWADNWLKDHGLAAHESLFIMLDATSQKEKTLTIPVYSEVLMYLLGFPDIKVLIFDEHRTGKDQFYRKLLPPGYFNRMIFSRGLSLREDLSLISSKQLRFMLGPCTGLMHCAAAIYSHFLKTIPADEPPLLITYTGKYSQPASYWWNNTPLMNVLMIRQKKGKKEMIQMDDLAEEEKYATGELLNCREYTSEMIIGYIKSQRRFIHQERI
jgi:ADP-heptose:LPS heptosyltransferase